MSINQPPQLIEEWAASIQRVQRTPRHDTPRREEFDVIVIGGGQAGLSVGYHLARAGLRFVILDAGGRVGDSWRNRWDSLRLFTPAKLDGLDGMPFPAPRNYFPTRDEMADYLERYASRFALPVRCGIRVDRLFRRNGRYVASAGARQFEADQVVVAMAKYQRPKVPAFASELATDITQLHSCDYRNLRQLAPGAVLLAGVGNSGADIALEAASGGHKTWLAGRNTGQIPFRPEGFLGRNLFMPVLLRFVFRHVLTVNTPLGRRARPNVLTRGGPRIRVKANDLAAAGVERIPRVIGVRDGLPLLEDGRQLEVANVIWCSGFEAGFDWIDLPVLDDDGEPRHRSGVVDSHPGLYFVGLPFLHSMSSSMIHGVGRDAARIVGKIRVRIGAGASIHSQAAFAER
ncbi:MAG TPA: NAD(P)/FAD-dependent oxidoreductase [Povalibacter sp.]|nr:NAD(P)/FAD-dependent oxidoreductase [Povalibacter sp.]